MLEIFIIILVVVGLFAVWFNYWNHKNPVGGKKRKQQPQQINKSSEQEWMDIIRKNREQHEREENNKKKDPEGELYDSEGKKIK